MEIHGGSVMKAQRLDEIPAHHKNPVVRASNYNGIGQTFLRPAKLPTKG